MIKAQHLSFTYALADHPQLEALNLDIAPGETVALVGGDGSGKSTLLHLISGLAPNFFKGQRSGELSVAGVDPKRYSLRERLRTVAYVSADPDSQLTGFCPTVEEEVAWSLGNLGLPRVEMQRRVNAILSELRLQELRLRSPQTLSSGQRQLVAFACALVLDPPLLLCDEVTGRLDSQTKRQLLEALTTLNSINRTVIWATSRLEEAVFFPRWVYLERGRIAYDGTPRIVESGALKAPWTRLAQIAKKRSLWTGDLPVREEQAADYWESRYGQNNR